jgi:hypothetical protein
MIIEDESRLRLEIPSISALKSPKTFQWPETSCHKVCPKCTSQPAMKYQAQKAKS